MRKINLHKNSVQPRAFFSEVVRSRPSGACIEAEGPYLGREEKCLDPLAGRQKTGMVWRSGMESSR